MTLLIEFMKRSLLTILLLTTLVYPLFAEHIKGGEMFYTYLGDGPAANTSRYTITLKLYIDCNATNPGQLDARVPLTIFTKGDNAFVQSVDAPLSNETFISFDPASNPCIGNPPSNVCYRVRSYSATVTLNNTDLGYTIAYQRCCRIDNIVNLIQPSNAVGATYTAEIPGTKVLTGAFKNSSPIFAGTDAAAICANSSFIYSFAATESDGDSVAYRLCSGFRGGSTSNPAPATAATPPYLELGYQSPFNGGSPLGASSRIDEKTGLITGIAPGVTGQYVITACAYEYRNGVLINIHRKDIHVAVSNCIPLKAFLKPDYAYCDDFLVRFRNEQLNPAGAQYVWSYGDGSKSDTTADPQGAVSHQYADTGTYTVKLKVYLASGQCVDSTTTKAKVYPGFYPGFRSLGTCILLPIQFTDTTRSRYGSPVKWNWNFGDETTLADTSRLRNPTWKYGSIGFKTVTLIVESDKGCIDTAINQVEVRDKPPMGLPFKDTLICSVDTLVLRATGNGIYSWGPAYNIFNENTPNPSVYPKVTTWYKATLNENGCINTDSLRIRVVDFVTLNAGPDTTICTTDTIRLNPASDGLQYIWTPNTRINNPNVKTPLVSPLTTTTYRVRAIIGKCNTEDDITIRTIPYPVANAGADTTICFDDTATLNGRINGIRYVWTPLSTLSTGNSLSPLAFPLTTTTYTLFAYDTLGCPKPGTDQVTVNVRARIIPFAGNDTSIVVGQNLQLNGSGGMLYSWAPPTYLNNPNIRNPIAVLNDNFSYVMRAYTPEGCFALDTINIKVFKTAPDIFVPNAFAPNGKNRILRPIPVGITRIEYFRVFNRWGQLVFQTADAGRGWDGTIAGKPQATGTYVWMAQGVDYTGRIVVRRGTAILIR